MNNGETYVNDIVVENSLVSPVYRHSGSFKIKPSAKKKKKKKKSKSKSRSPSPSRSRSPSFMSPPRSQRSPPKSPKINKDLNDPLLSKLKNRKPKQKSAYKNMTWIAHSIPLTKNKIVVKDALKPMRTRSYAAQSNSLQR